MLVKCDTLFKRDFTNLFTNYERCKKCFKYDYCYIGNMIFLTMYTNCILDTLELLEKLDLQETLIYLTMDIDYQELIIYSYLDVKRIIYVCELKCSFL